jgi:hypothetical protein
MEAYRAIPDWKEFDLSEPPGREKAIHIDHGYDETVPLEKLTVSDLQQAAEFRGGQLLSETYDGDPAKKLRWRCHDGHTFEASPKLVLEGGHWCPECLPPEWHYAEQAAHNPFIAQVIHP